MSSFKNKPKKQNPYPKLLNEFERRRQRDWAIDKAGKQANRKKINPTFQARNSQMLQRFSGKRGK